MWSNTCFYWKYFKIFQIHISNVNTHILRYRKGRPRGHSSYYICNCRKIFLIIWKISPKLKVGDREGWLSRKCSRTPLTYCHNQNSEADHVVVLLLLTNYNESFWWSHDFFYPILLNGKIFLSGRAPIYNHHCISLPHDGIQTGRLSVS